MRRIGVWAILVLTLSLSIVACGKQDVNAALLKAAETGNVGSVKELLQKGADPNTLDEFKRTPLMIASINGRAEVVKALIEAKADISARAKFGQTALEFATERGDTAIAGLLKAAQVVNPPNVPPPKGPYSHAMVWEDLVFVSAQGPLDRATGDVKHGDVLEEMAVAVENTRIILEAAGSSLQDALKVTVYLADLKDVDRVNAKYEEYFGPVFPALTVIQADMPFEIKIEIDVIAHKK
jgi:2-iminobutanoate/2-iminopropanoate deaminase